MALLALVRGLPGSGKTTLALTLQAESGAAHLEADFFHTHKGEYHYIRKYSHSAHAWCEAKAAHILAIGDNVIVANTFVTRQQMDPYILHAKEEGHKVSIFEATGEYENVHGVPEDVIQRMRDIWETVSTGGLRNHYQFDGIEVIKVEESEQPRIHLINKE